MYPSLAFGASIGSLAIMVIDENRGMQRIIAAVLMANRIARVRTVADTHKALDEMIAAPPDALIVDWSLRDSDAETLIRTMRTAAMHPLCFVPVICLAAAVSRAQVAAMLDAGATTILRKPFATRDLMDHVERLVRDGRPFRLEGSRYVQGVRATIAVERPLEDTLFIA